MVNRIGFLNLKQPKHNLDINKVQMRLNQKGYHYEWLMYGICNLSSLELSYDGGRWYTSFLFYKELIDDFENSVLTIFWEYLFKTFGDVYYYYNEEMEGYNFAKSKIGPNGVSMLDFVDNVFTQYGVEKSNLILHTGNLNIHENFPYDFIPVYTISHFFHNNYTPRPFTEKTIQKKFLYLNKMAKEERYSLYLKFKDANLLDNFYYTINAIKDPMYSDSVSLEDTAPSIEAGMTLMDDLYNTTFINIISESEYWNNKVSGHCYKSIFFTEKTAKALNTFSPFIILGCSGSLKKLNEIGFKTFNDWWDESYDDETDDDKRIIKIHQLVKTLCKLSESEIETMYSEMIPTLKHNQSLYQKMTNKQFQYEMFLPELLQDKKCFYSF